MGPLYTHIEGVGDGEHLLADLSGGVWWSGARLNRLDSTKQHRINTTDKD